MFKLFKFRTSYDVIRVQTPENCMRFVFTTNLNRQVFVLHDSSRQLRVSVLLLVTAGSQSETRAVAFCKTKNHPFLWWYTVCFYFRSNSVDSNVSSWTKALSLFLGMSATFWRQRGNGAVEVSFENRTAQTSALFHIFTCVVSAKFHPPKGRRFRSIK